MSGIRGRELVNQEQTKKQMNKANQMNKQVKNNQSQIILNHTQDLVLPAPA